MADLTCEEKLAEARTALHKLTTGSKAVDVAYGDRRVRYVQADESKLRAYISELEAECGSCSDKQRRRRPLTTSFDHCS